MQCWNVKSTVACAKQSQRPSTSAKGLALTAVLIDCWPSGNDVPFFKNFINKKQYRKTTEFLTVETPILFKNVLCQGAVIALCMFG